MRAFLRSVFYRFKTDLLDQIPAPLKSSEKAYVPSSIDTHIRPDRIDHFIGASFVKKRKGARGILLKELLQYVASLRIGVYPCGITQKNLYLGRHIAGKSRGFSPAEGIFYLTKGLIYSLKE
jgi:hypothetical protein